MRKLNGMIMRPNQDPDKYLTEVFLQRDEFKHISEIFTEAGILDLTLEGPSDKCESIIFTGERDSETSLK